MNTDITIHEGGMYQKWMSLIDLIDKESAKKLNMIASKEGWRKVLPNEAIEMGFEELVSWSKPETDILVLVGEDYLVCLNKSELATNRN